MPAPVYQLLYCTTVRFKLLYCQNKNVFFTFSVCFLCIICVKRGLPGGANGKESACQCRRCKRHRFDSWVGKIPQRRKWQPTPIFLPENSHGQRSLAGFSPWSLRELDTTEQTYYKPITVQYYTADCVSSAPRLWAYKQIRLMNVLWNGTCLYTGGLLYNVISFLLLL